MHHIAADRVARRGPTLLAAFVPLLLVGCSGEPSAGDIRRAMEQQLERAGNDPFGRLVAGTADDDQGKFMEIHELHKIGCTPDGERAYACDVEAEMSLMGMRDKTATRIRLVRGKDGWIAAE